jgi:hypothetical protein
MRMEHGQRQEWSLVHPDEEAARLKLACVLTESEAPMQRIALDGSGVGPRLRRSGLVSGKDAGIQCQLECRNGWRPTARARQETGGRP